MRAALEAVIGNYSIYKARKDKFETGQKIPFRVSPVPFQLTLEQKREIYTIGHDVTAYFQVVDEIYQKDIGLKAILDMGKPQIFINNQPSHYLFVRPDLILTPQGFSLCEIETSPFGLALAEILNRAYQSEGFETLIPKSTLSEEVKKRTPVDGKIIFSNKTQAYSGQMAFLADQIFSDTGRKWQAETAQEYVENEEHDNIYRGFYLGEYLTDPYIHFLIDDYFENNNYQLLPSPTPYLEEKAILSFIYDKRFEKNLKHKLGNATFKHLRNIIPPTWIVGQEKYFSQGLPGNVSTSLDLARLPRSKRTLVLKSSGFSEDSSWKEGVRFLHKESIANATKLLQQAQENKSHLYIIQEFKKAIDISMKYEKLEDERVHLPMTARVRLTPYFSLPKDGQTDRLIAIKATACENTDFIHASSISINTSVS